VPAVGKAHREERQPEDGAALASANPLDAVSTVVELAGAIGVPEARLQFSRMLHLLVRCELVILA
jgi:hypothetical protein